MFKNVKLKYLLKKKKVKIMIYKYFVLNIRTFYCSF